jgi:hypothetical protein
MKLLPIAACPLFLLSILACTARPAGPGRRPHFASDVEEAQWIWSRLRAALAAKDVELAASYFVERRRGTHTILFHEMRDKLPDIATHLPVIEFVARRPDGSLFFVEAGSKRRDPKEDPGVTFVRDYDGVWRVAAW